MKLDTAILQFKKIHNTFAICVALLASGVSHAAVKHWKIIPTQSSVQFLATGKPGFLRFKGEGAKIEGQATLDGSKLTGDFEVKLDSITTGIDLRDEHMKTKYLETGKFPAAKLSLNPLIIDPTNEALEQPFTGKLTIKGVEKPVSGKFTVAFTTTSDEVATGQASLKLNLSDYPVGVPSHLGVTVAESIVVSVNFVASPLEAETLLK